MSKLKVEQFVDLVKKSGLVDDERLNQALSGFDESVKDSGIVASNLTKAGLLTEWQSEKLLQGRHKGFYLGKYKLLNHLGTGGMGAVYLAEHQVMRHRVAIKLLPKPLAAQSSYLERFIQEAQASAALSHPNIIRAFDVDQHESMHYLVMEYVEGSDLQVVVSRAGPLPFEVAAEYVRQAAEGLAYAHRMGLIHRDIKPANMLVDKEGTLKILDMGLARFGDETQGSLTMAYDQKMIGTVDYLAPEQALDSHKVDGRADIYSLGCSFYFLLTGDAPFPTGTIPQRLLQHQSAEPTPIRKTRPDAPQELIDICAHMMAKAKEDRYQTADDLAQTLNDWLVENGFRSGSTSGASKSPNREPIDPTINENLTLAPIEDEVRNGRVGHAAPSSEHVTDNPAGNSGVKGPAGSGVGKSAGSNSGVTGPSPSGVGKTSSPGKPPSGVGKTSSAGKPASGVGRTNPKPKSDIKSGHSAPVKLPNLSHADESLDDLLNAPAPASSGALNTVPLNTGSYSTQEESLMSRLGIMAGASLLGAGLLFGLILFLIWLTTKL